MSKVEEVIILRGKYEGCQAWVNRSKKQPPKNIHLIIMYDVNGDGELVEHQTHLSRRSIEYKKEMDEKETSMDKVQFMAVGSQPKIRMAMRKLVDEIAQTGIIEPAPITELFETMLADAIKEHHRKGMRTKGYCYPMNGGSYAFFCSDEAMVEFMLNRNRRTSKTNKRGFVDPHHMVDKEE